MTADAAQATSMTEAFIRKEFTVVTLHRHRAFLDSRPRTSEDRSSDTVPEPIPDSLPPCRGIPVLAIAKKGLDMLHAVALATSDPVAAGFILRGIKGIFVAVGSVIAALVCGLIALTKGRNPLGWGILGLFFSILTLIVIIVIPSKK
jgi:hypothetical protein